MTKKNINFHQLSSQENNQEFKIHDLSLGNKNTQNLDQQNFKTIKIAFLLLFLIFTTSLICFIFYLHNQLQIVRAKIPQHQPSVSNFALNKNQQEKLEAYIKSFFRSWKQNIINKQNLKKITKIKELIQNQPHFLERDLRRKEPYLLSMNNHKVNYYNDTLQKEISQLLQSQYERMSSIYDFSLPQLPFCIVITSVNNSKDSRYEHNLRSILNQNYTNYKVVIIDDASGDENAFLIRQLIEEIAPSQKIFLIKNEKNMAKLANFYKAAHEYCSEDEIAFTVDGDDQLLGINVFKVFNDRYQKENLQFAYSNAIRSTNDAQLIGSYAQAYTKKQIESVFYRRRIGTKVFNLVSFKVSNFRKIKIEDFQDDNGEWFRCAADEAMWPPLMQLSCGKLAFIDEYLYLNYRSLGNNNMEIHPSCNRQVKQTMVRRPKYPCSSQI